MKVTPLGPWGHPMHRVLHVTIPDRYDLALTFVRMQEWYESPKFHRKKFTLEEFMRWYSKKQGKGVFTYPEDWSGFNIPSTAVEAVVRMHPWTDAEASLFARLTKRGLLNYVAGSPPAASLYVAPLPFYLIGTSKSDPGVLEHEKAHGRFFIYPDYRRAVQRAVRSFDTSSLAKGLLKQGYSKWTLEDEIHAYALTGWPRKYKPTAPLRALRSELLAIASK